MLDLIARRIKHGHGDRCRSILVAVEFFDNGEFVFNIVVEVRSTLAFRNNHCGFHGVKFSDELGNEKQENREVNEHNGSFFLSV